MTKRALVPLAQACEELEAITITDVLVRGGIEVTTASLDDNRHIQASRGAQLVADTTLAEISGEVFDLVVLPGGLPGADYLNESEALRLLLQQTDRRGGIIAAICAAPRVLATAGLLDGKEATSFPGTLDVHPAKDMVYLSQPVVDTGRVVTSRSAGTAMLFALTLVEKLMGAEKRQEVEKAMLLP